MEYLLISLWFILLHQTNPQIVCQIYDMRFKSLQEHCKSVPAGCSRQLQTIESYQVGQLTVEGCNANIIANEVNKFIYVTTVNIRQSESFNLNYLTVKLDRLKLLNVSHNNVQQLNKEIFIQMPEMIEIDLSYNALEHLEWGAFDYAKKLMRIHLSHNKLIEIQPETILSLTHLDFIDLSYNRLQSIPEFFNNKMLTLIHLAGNPISTYDCFHLRRMSSVSLYYSWEDLLYIYGNWHCSGKQMLVVRDAKSEGIFITTNSIIKYQFACSDQSFKHLLQFVAGRNAFTNIEDILKCFTTSIETIDLSGNIIKTLDVNTFERFSNLNELSLSDCQLKHFDMNIIMVPNKLHLLDISSNNLKYISNAHIFQRFSYLHELKLADNQLENTSELIQHLKSSVEYLDLSKNSISLLNPNVFNHLSKLNVLNLSDTRLSIADYNPFEAITTLLSLDVSYNSLGQTNLSILSTTLNRLEYFYAAHCQFTNAIDLIPLLSSSLIELNLSGNYIQRINNQMFFHIRNVRILDISYNQLDEVDVGQLSDRLERINLEGNNLRKIHQLSRVSFVSLKSMAVSNNALPCKDLKEMMHEWEGIELIGDSFKQKHTIDCHLNSNSGFLTSIFNKIKFW